MDLQGNVIGGERDEGPPVCTGVWQPAGPGWLLVLSFRPVDAAPSACLRSRFGHMLQGSSWEVGSFSADPLGLVVLLLARPGWARMQQPTGMCWMPACMQPHGVAGLHLARGSPHAAVHALSASTARGLPPLCLPLCEVTLD